MRRYRIAGLAFCVLIGLGNHVTFATEPTTLPDAAQAGDHATVLVLLKEGEDVDARQRDGTTALHWAAYGGDAELARLLLDAGADPNAENRNGAIPLTLACKSASDDVIEVLLVAGADPNLAPTGEPPLLTCARAGDVSSVQALLDAGAKIDSTDQWRGQTSLMWAAAENHADILAVLLKAGAYVNTASKGKFTALLFAVRQDARESTRLLIDAGADVNVVAPGGKTALSVAILNQHYTLAALLLEAGADANARDRRGNTVLHDLVSSRSPRRRLDRQFAAGTPDDPNQISSLDLLDRLIAKGADINARTEPVPILHERWTDKGIKSAGRPLMDNAVNVGGATPYLLAARLTDVAAMRNLADHGADTRLATFANNTAVMLAAGVGHVEGSRRFRSEDVALEAVEMALAEGVDVNASNANGQTALHGAVYRAADSVIRRLVEAGARTDLKDELGRTALDLAEQGFNQVASVIRRERSAALLRELGAVSSQPKKPASPKANAKK